MSPTRTLRVHLVSAFTLLLLALCPRLYAYDLTVDRSQPASATNFLTVQAAVTAATTTGRTATTPFTIYIRNGKYKELVTVPSTKPFLQLIGESVANTIITYNNSGGTFVAGVMLGTQGSATVDIKATDFSAVNLTFENSFGEAASNGQAVALLVEADRAAFRNCRFLGNQDTMYLKGSGTPRAFFLNCYIEGNTDFIFGSSIALFESCNVFAKVKSTTTTSYIVAPNTATGQAFGFVFKSCNVTGNPVADGSHTRYDLGRPWQFTPQASYLNCNLSTPLILAEGWSPTSSAGTATIGDSYFTEYQNTHFNGNRIDTTMRVKSGANLVPSQKATQLKAAQAANYTRANILSANGTLAAWDPCATIDCATPFVRSVIVNNFKGTKGTTMTPSAFTFNTSFPISGDVLSVYRSTNGGTYSPVAALAQTEPNDTTYNYAFTDPIPASGSYYKYYIQGSLTPRQISSDTVTISSAPTIVASGTFGGFTQTLGTPSASQTVNISGTDLTAGITVTAPANYQVSLALGSGYTANGGNLTIPASSGAVASTPIYVRLNAAALGTYTGNVALTSTGAVPVNLAVTGTTLPVPTATFGLLQEWPLRKNIAGGVTGTVTGYPTLQITSADSAQVRNASLVATTPTFAQLYLSNGTQLNTSTPPAVTQAYSTRNGQAFAANPSGNGQWTNGATPAVSISAPTLAYYEQFTVQVASGASARVDSLVFAAGLYNSSAGRLGILYSLDGFVTATDISGGTLAGSALTFTAGSSGNPKYFGLPNQTGALAEPANLFKIALNGPTTCNPTGGVTVPSGQILAIRFYFAANSSGIPRYAYLKNLRVRGDARPVSNLTVTTANQSLSGTYNSITIGNGGTATVVGALTVNNSLTVQDGGTLNTICQPITGAGSFTVAAGATVSVGNMDGLTSSGTLGGVQMTGTRRFSNDANYLYNGTAAQVTGNGLPTRVRNLTVNNSTGVTLTQALAVSQAVNLTSGNLTAGTTPAATPTNNLTLLSVSGQGTALINNTGTNVVTGSKNVMQRAVDVVLTGDNIGYHHYSSPMTTETVGTLAAPGFAPILNDATSPAFNMAAQVGYVRPFPTVFGYDETRVGSTQYAIDQSPFNQGYVAPANALAPWMPGKGYSANVPNAVVVDFQGQFNNAPTATAFTGLQSLSRGGTSDSGWQLLGNVFPSPLDWSSVAPGQLTNVSTTIYQYHATSRYNGSFTFYQTSGAVNGGLGNGSPLVPAGGGFFARVATAGTGSISLSNANRITTFGTQPNFGRAAGSARPTLRLALAGNGSTDEAFFVLDARATPGPDDLDAAKLANPSGLNLAALAASQPQCIAALPVPAATTLVPLQVAVPTAGTYSLSVAELANFTATPVYLRDALTGTRTLLAAGTRYAFTLAGPAAAAGRFVLEFAPAGAALATTPSVLAAGASVYPNPARGRFTLAVPPVVGTAQATATLLNALGQVVSRRTLALPATGTTADYATAGLPAGVYALRLQAGPLATTLRVVVE